MLFVSMIKSLLVFLFCFLYVSKADDIIVKANCNGAITLYKACEKGSIVHESQLLALIDGLPENSSPLTSPVSGHIADIYVANGEIVSYGQNILVITPSEEKNEQSAEENAKQAAVHKSDEPMWDDE